nr:hypothetical protein [Tanacetum cinerariifolium]
MRVEGLATWDGGKVTWGGRVRVYGIVPVCVYAQEIAGGEGWVLAGKWVRGVLFGQLGFRGLAHLVLGVCESLQFRRSLEFNGETENEDPPREFSRDAIMTQLARLPMRVKGKHLRFRGVKIKRNIFVKLNWTKRFFYELVYWSFLILKHNLDVMHIEKTVLESILNTLLMNDKSKDTAEARQDLKRLGIRNGLWLSQDNNGKCSKPHSVYSFTPEDRKKFCQFIKGVKLSDGFRSNFKHKVTDNDTNITGLKSHDCRIMMQRLLPYRLQQYLPPPPPQRCKTTNRAMFILLENLLSNLDGERHVESSEQVGYYRGYFTTHITPSVHHENEFEVFHVKFMNNGVRSFSVYYSHILEWDARQAIYDRRDESDKDDQRRIITINGPGI